MHVHLCMGISSTFLADVHFSYMYTMELQLSIVVITINTRPTFTQETPYSVRTKYLQNVQIKISLSQNLIYIDKYNCYTESQAFIHGICMHAYPTAATIA